MPRATPPIFIEVGEDKYSVEFTYPAPLLEGHSKEDILLVPKHFLCDSVIKSNKDGTILICKRLIDAEIGEIIYANSSGNPPEGSAEVPNINSESGEGASAQDNVG